MQKHTDKPKNIHGVPPKSVESPLTMKELTTVLIKHYGIHEGKYDILIEFQIGMGLIGPNENTKTPGAMVGVNKIGLIPSPPVDTPMTIDAAQVNPAP